ncbi:MAG: radical SAM protein [Firmicutes bacterium]|nr:radical SAM protein [Bacillota bacterium]
MSQTNILDLANCTLCPRECGVNRLAGQLGFCQTPGALLAARAALLWYEEPCLVGRTGSGAVFFSGCSLGCTFCQNYDLSRGARGTASKAEEITPEHLCRIFFSLKEQGAANINLVTASHLLPLVIPALRLARSQGLGIPIVYNTSSYEKVEAIRALEGLVDIYLPDLKFYDPALSARYCRAKDYFDRAFAVIREMVRQCPEPVFSDGSHSLDEADDADDPLLCSGVIVRHLCMPGCTKDSKEILSRLHEAFGNQIFISIMNQYTPMPQCKDDPLLSRPLTKEEYDEVTDYAIQIGIENGFLQEGGTVSKSFIPAFDGTGI